MYEYVIDVFALNPCQFHKVRFISDFFVMLSFKHNSYVSSFVSHQAMSHHRHIITGHHLVISHVPCRAIVSKRSNMRPALHPHDI